VFLATGALLAPAARSAPPALPATVPYQGVLLDAGGAPRTGSVDLTLRIYDAIVGGTLLYKQLTTAVPLTDGVFSVTLGPMGSATDAPANPLTTSLADALAGDVGATSPSRFLEITVGTTGALARTQIVSVPYALHAGSAATATTADSATTATTANDVTTVNGVPSAVLSQLFAHVDFDGGEPPNDSPLEGVADADGDGVANFLEPDNDADGLSDVAEFADGTDLNLVTPVVSGVNPLGVYASLTTTVTVSGQNFAPGLSVAFGSETPPPTDLTATSFKVAVGPQSAGPANVVVTLANGESDSFTGAFFFDFPPTGIHGLALPADAQLSLDVTGLSSPLVGGVGQVALDLGPDGDFDVVALANSNDGTLAAGFAPGNQPAVLRCKPTDPFHCDVQLIRDADAVPTTFEAATFVEKLANGTSPNIPIIKGPSFAYDPAGRPVLGYVKFASFIHAVAVSRDANGDGDFADTGEIQNLGTIGNSRADGGDLAIDSAGRPAYAFLDTGAGVLKVAYDRSGDGDFSDTMGGNPETFTAASGSVTCFGVSFDDGARLAMVWDAGAGTKLARDANADGDFADAGEVIDLAAGPAQGCDVDGAASGGLAVAHDGDDLRLLVDRDDDGSFSGTGENVVLAPAGSGTHPVRVRQGGIRAVATGTSFYVDPLP
jgi:hypothetical protein